MTDKRLLTCAKLVTGKKAVDVGTDHGYLAVYLVENGICDEVIASDVNEKPLAAAFSTVRMSEAADRIDVVLSDGLDNIDKDGVTDVIMAGMGGELIAQLIAKCSWLSDEQKPINLVLQPMTKSEILRKWLYDNGFAVKQELGCSDGGFVYSVIQTEYIGAKPDYACDDRYIYGGKVSSDDPEGEAYLRKQSQRMKTAGNGMLKSDNKKHEGQKLIEAAQMLLK